MLLVLLLMCSLMVIALAVAAPSIAFSIKRDREQELIHRGVEYGRAIRVYYRRNGGYPTSVEQLQQREGVRYLRHAYKDPITGKDFRLLRFSDVQLSEQARIAVVSQSVEYKPPPGAVEGSGEIPTPTDPTAALQPDANANPADPNAPAKTDANAKPAPAVVDEQPDLSASDTGQITGVGPIIGVASLSHEHTIREFRHKAHYNEWKFYYDAGANVGPVAGPTQDPRLAPPAPPVASVTPDSAPPHAPPTTAD